MEQSKTTYLIDNFVTVTPGQPFRLLPFGRIVKGGKVRDITREIAARFRIPHFKPPIKLGGHADNLPAGGHIVGLEVRDDGLYAIPEFNDDGQAALKAGAFRYQSPEVMWNGGFEDPQTGEVIEGPMIVGTALLHNPHLGEAAALYSVEPMEVTMSESVTVPVTIWEKLWDRFSAQPEPPAPEPTPAPVEVVQHDEYAAIAAERDELAAKIAALEAQGKRRERVDQFAAALTATKVAGDDELAELLADLEEEKAQALMTRFAALSAQIDESHLTADVGHTGDDNPLEGRAALHAEIERTRQEKGVDYLKAWEIVRDTKPELFGG